jgi:hypothetical protein
MKYFFSFFSGFFAMSGRRGQANDMVTIIYPPGCREVNNFIFLPILTKVKIDVVRLDLFHD